MALTEDEIAAKTTALRLEIELLRANPSVSRKIFWLSFADERGFRGGCLVDDVVNFFDAVAQSRARGCNPGGEVRSIEVPAEWVQQDFPRNTLLSQQQLSDLGGFVPMS